MTAPVGRRSGRRVLSWLLALALLGVIGFVVLRDVEGREPEPVATTVVTGVIGSEKAAFFADERVRAAFLAHGLEVRVDPAGSRQIATTVRLDGYDFAFPSSSPTADKLLALHPAARTYAPFSSPMAVATFAPIVDLRASVGSRPAVPVFCVLFGESNVEEMEEVARLTGGRTFDARTAPLAEVFTEIRGYV